MHCRILFKMQQLHNAQQIGITLSIITNDKLIGRIACKIVVLSQSPSQNTGSIV